MQVYRKVGLLRAAGVSFSCWILHSVQMRFSPARRPTQQAAFAPPLAALLGLEEYERQLKDAIRAAFEARAAAYTEEVRASGTPFLVLCGVEPITHGVSGHALLAFSTARRALQVNVLALPAQGAHSMLLCARRCGG